mgnify:FL=1
MTRQKLLEHFDEEVHEKLKVNLQASNEYLNRYESLLWKLTMHALAGVAEVDEGQLSFVLNQDPFAGGSIPLGRYRLGHQVTDAHHYRFGHPLAQQVLEEYRAADVSGEDLLFDYSASPSKVTVLEALVGKSGWLRLDLMTVTSFETEDHLLWAAIADDGESLTAEQCRRLFNLPADMRGAPQIGEPEDAALTQQLQRHRKDILQANAERDSGFFDSEMGKLDHWADDMKTSLEIRLKQLDVEIKTRKAEARKIINLQEKVKVHRSIKELECTRNDMRLNLYQAQDDVEEKKERLIEGIETRLNQELSQVPLFTIRWQLV